MFFDFISDFLKNRIARVRRDLMFCCFFLLRVLSRSCIDSRYHRLSNAAVITPLIGLLLRQITY